MSVVRGDAARRWATVAGLASLLVAVPILLNVRPVASASVSAEAVVAAAAASSSVAHQGLAQISTTFGVPALPVGDDETELLDSTTRVRTWWSAPDAWRVDTLLATGQESAFAVAGTSPPVVRQWSFENATLVEVPADPPLRLPRADDLLPPQLARSLLGWTGPGDRVEHLASRRVAGIAAAGARIVVGDSRSTVGRVDLWIDPATGLPLEVAAYAVNGTRPLIDSRFLTVDLATPDPAVLSPDLTRTTSIRPTETTDFLARISALEPASLPDRLGDLTRIEEASADLPNGVGTYGTGFIRVTVVTLPERFMGRVFDEVGASSTPLAVAGGQAVLLTSPLLSLAFVQDSETGQGYVVAGAVTPAALESAVITLLVEQ